LDVVVHGRNVAIAENVRTLTSEKVSRLSRFLDGMDHAEVLFLEERNPRIPDKEVCEITVAGHGHMVRAKAAAGDQLAAVDRAVDKLEHQLTRLKGKLVGRSHPRRHAPVNSVPIQDDEIQEEGLQIVKTKRFSIKPMTPEEAALQMDLLGHGFYFFTNADTQQAAVVYRRNDGGVGLIEAD
jgi:putative sigma-54 modulation protein